MRRIVLEHLRVRASRSAPASRSRASATTAARSRRHRNAARRGDASTASHLLVATGRRRTSKVSISKRPASSSSRAASWSTRGLTTTNKKVYAIGDVAGGPQFTHVANYHAGIVIRNALFRLRRRQDEADPVGHLHGPGTRACRA